MKMNKVFAVLALLLIASLLIQGCAKEEAPEGPTEGTAEETAGVDEDFSELDNLEEELSMDELEDLDKELEELNW